MGTRGAVSKNKHLLLIIINVSPSVRCTQLKFAFHVLETDEISLAKFMKICFERKGEKHSDDSHTKKEARWHDGVVKYGNG